MWLHAFKIITKGVILSYLLVLTPVKKKNMKNWWQAGKKGMEESKRGKIQLAA